MIEVNFLYNGCAHSACRWSGNGGGGDGMCYDYVASYSDDSSILLPHSDWPLSVCE